jgi:hypothetical protein
LPSKSGKPRLWSLQNWQAARRNGSENETIDSKI